MATGLGRVGSVKTTKKVKVTGLSKNDKIDLLEIKGVGKFKKVKPIRRKKK